MAGTQVSGHEPPFQCIGCDPTCLYDDWPRCACEIMPDLTRAEACAGGLCHVIYGISLTATLSIYLRLLRYVGSMLLRKQRTQSRRLWHMLWLGIAWGTVHVLRMAALYIVPKPGWVAGVIELLWTQGLCLAIDVAAMHNANWVQTLVSMGQQSDQVQVWTDRFWIALSLFMHLIVMPTFALLFSLGAIGVTTETSLCVIGLLLYLAAISSLTYWQLRKLLKAMRSWKAVQVMPLQQRVTSRGKLVMRFYILAGVLAVTYLFFWLVIGFSSGLYYWTCTGAPTLVMISEAGMMHLVFKDVLSPKSKVLTKRARIAPASAITASKATLSPASASRAALSPRSSGPLSPKPTKAPTALLA